MKRVIPSFFVLCAISVGFLSVSVARGGGTKVLYLGDSLSIGAFGKTFDHSMRTSGFDVYTVVAGGASPYYWLKSYDSLPCTIGFWEKTPTSERRVGYVRAVPKLEDLLSSHQPKVVVVQTGINLYATLRSRRREKSENVAEVQSLIEKMCYSIAESGAISYWVLPPHSHEQRYPSELQDELRSIMRGVVNKYEGAVFESQQVTHFDDPYPATDGVHYGPVEARGWAEKVSSHFNEFMQVDFKPAENKIARALPIQSKPKTSSKLPIGSTSSGLQNQPSEVDLNLKLVEKSTIEHTGQLEYSNALGVFEYEVLEDRLGNYPFDRIRVAHGIVIGRKHTRAADREIGSTISLSLAPLTKYKVLSTWQLVDELRPNFELPLYTPKLD